VKRTGVTVLNYRDLKTEEAVWETLQWKKIPRRKQKKVRAEKRDSDVSKKVGQRPQLKGGKGVRGSSKGKWGLGPLGGKKGTKDALGRPHLSRDFESGGRTKETKKEQGPREDQGKNFGQQLRKKRKKVQRTSPQI